MNEGVFRVSLSCDRVYEPTEVLEFLSDADVSEMDLVKGSKAEYYDVPAAFDIETTSFYDDGDKAACMYAWMLGLNGLVMLGRTWTEYLGVICVIAFELGLSDKRRLPVYVHNLAYEFQFIRRMFTWADVFSLDVRKPLRALSSNGVEYRCSMLLSGYSLARLGSELKSYDVEKMVGDLDYDLPRHSGTPLTEREVGYCVNDVRVVMAYISEQISEEGNITRLPMTKTGYVRRYCRDSCLKGKRKNWDYVNLMSECQLEADEYMQLKRAFQGGFTHANPFYSGKTVRDVTSYDFTSSYPAVMVGEMFPMSRGERHEVTSKEDFERSIKCYCCVFDIEVVGLQSEVYYESYLSLSRCWAVERAVTNNGRIVSADRLMTTMTEQDWIIFKRFYTWDHVRVGNMTRYLKDYLPTCLVRSILKLYEDKTTLKGVEGAEVDYMRSKEMLNSCYGMCVTDVVRPEFTYSDHWEEPKPPVLADAISEYNENRGRFLFYPWGVWVTAYARRNLFTGICEFGDDYVYSDTDSIKVMNAGDHIEYIERYNRIQRDRLIRSMDYHGLPHELIEPMTIDGKVKQLGVWDFDGHYSEFKTLGAKRYMVRYSHDTRNPLKSRGELSLTVSGINKSKALPYIKSLDIYPFDFFKDGMRIPEGMTGKMTHTYIDEPVSGNLTDYLGNTGRYSELSCVHLEAVDYSMSISREYADYLAGVHYIGGDSI